MEAEELEKKIRYGPIKPTLSGTLERMGYKIMEIVAKKCKMTNKYSEKNILQME